MAPTIIDHQAYCDAMQGSLEQKLFFTEHLPDLNVLLDYGSADGAIARELLQRDNDTHIVCYDVDKAMLARCPDALLVTPIGTETTALGILHYPKVMGDTDPTGILFSSVLHELYSQQSLHQMRAFWQRIADTGVDYIIVRDMYWGNPFEQPAGWPIYEVAAAATLIEEQFPEQSSDYETEVDLLHTPKNIVHFLLKQPYKCNWRRELQEDYFSVPDLRPILAELGYEVQLFEHHQVDYIQERIKADTGIDLPFNTHLKAIFKRVQPVLK